MPNEFPKADPNTSVTYDVTYVSGISDDERVEDRKVVVATVLNEMEPKNLDPGDPVWDKIDSIRDQLKIDLFGPNGNKAIRGAVRPPGTARPPANRVLSVVLNKPELEPIQPVE